MLLAGVMPKLLTGADPAAQRVAFLVGHAGLVAERHGPILHGLNIDLLTETPHLRRCLERDVLRRLPEGGEPIHVGHHSESAHRSAIAKADAAIRRSIDADTDARRARARADIAAGANEARYAPITVANRIEKLRADQVSLRRRLEGYSRTLPGGYLDITPAATGDYAERLTRELAAVDEQHAYWQAVREEQIAAGIVANHSRDTIRPGDQIRYFGAWCTVTRTNAKSVSITDTYGHRGTVPYTHIREHRAAEKGASS